MLLFRSEEHVARWCRDWNLPRGATLTPELCWRLSREWFADRRAPEWRRRTVEEAQALFAGLGLVSPFWQLRKP